MKVDKPANSKMATRRKFLPENHLTSDAKDVVRLATGLVVTMSALVLGMLVSSAKSSYDLQKSQVSTMAAKIVLLDAQPLD